MKESLLTSHVSLSWIYLSYDTFVAFILLILGLCNILYLALSRFQTSCPLAAVLKTGVARHCGVSAIYAAWQRMPSLSRTTALLAIRTSGL